MAQSSIKFDIHTPMIDHPNTDEKSITTMAAATPHIKQRLLPEIILRLIEVMVEADDEKFNRPTIICLGLTARIYWDFLKAQYPMQQRSATSLCFPTSLDEPFLDIHGMRRLTKALKTWIGPDYRQVSELFLDETKGCQIMFLHRKIYGDSPDDDVINPHEYALLKRIRHWKHFPFKSWPPTIPFHSPILKTLSNPYGMGIQWYSTAAQELLNLLVSCKRYKQLHPVSHDSRLGYLPYRISISYIRGPLWLWVREEDDKDTAEVKDLKRQVRDLENVFGRLRN
ncbi:hypothetical protein BOTCAL_0640g00070 [Botryotinia calthae]|uniref:Uncharacterized protein n=1 Tax=Botryotinia calthae TaxID=38488 RepID=A0A4Y8CJV5_9HELO|nr:hypothetical protein BOTCAL_0640g00070 [Botryotinia calthae]